MPFYLYLMVNYSIFALWVISILLIFPSLIVVFLSIPPPFLVDSCLFTPPPPPYNPFLPFAYLNCYVNVSCPLHYLVLISNLAVLNLFYSVFQLKLSQYFLALSNSFIVQHIIRQMIHSSLGIMN